MPVSEELWLYRPGGLGDALLTIPAFQAARRRWPGRSTVLAVARPWCGLPWQAMGLADRVVDARGLETHATLFSEAPAGTRPAALVTWLPPGAHADREAWRERAGEVVVGEAPGGKVTQLITVSLGLDDWEWGVTLWARKPEFLKEIVYTMRFDEASAVYAEFGPFYVSYVTSPAEMLKHCRVGT